MLADQNWILRKATERENSVIARHFYQLWLDNNVSLDSIRNDWLEVTLQFIERSRQELSFQAFVVEIENRIVASASCQLFAGLYPSPFKSQCRQYGYIWNVYLESAYRSRGIAAKLTKECLNYLKSIGCTRAILHASPHGKPVYEKLGFVASNEMGLDLIDL